MAPHPNQDASSSQSTSGLLAILDLNQVWSFSSFNFPVISYKYLLGFAINLKIFQNKSRASLVLNFLDPFLRDSWIGFLRILEILYFLVITLCFEFIDFFLFCFCDWWIILFGIDSSLHWFCINFNFWLVKKLLKDDLW